MRQKKEKTVFQSSHRMGVFLVSNQKFRFLKKNPFPDENPRPSWSLTDMLPIELFRLGLKHKSKDLNNF